jgi:hypothetical protein
VGRLCAIALASACALAGCGSGDDSDRASPRTTTAAAATSTTGKCKGSADPAVVRRKLARLRRDLARIRALAAPIRTRTLDGTPALSAAVDRFLLDMADKDVPVLLRSRLIDRAAAAVSPVCEQCFQALEANRPVGGGAKLTCEAGG